MATTTTYVDSTFSASVIGARTDSDGSAVTDLTAEEARFPSATFAEGAMTDDAFKVAEQGTPDMTVKVGSGTAKSDYYCVSGEVAGQGNYIVRLDVTGQNITIGAADVAQDRTDEVYLIVLDDVYDVSSKALPRLALRKGEVGGGAPGADSTWKAYALLATVTVSAGATTITDDDIEDERTIGGPGNQAAQVVTAKGDLLVASGSGVLARLGVGSNDQVLTADSTTANGVKWASAPDPGEVDGAQDRSVVTDSFSTTSSAYVSGTSATDLSATATVGGSGVALVLFRCTGDGEEAIAHGLMSVALSGANTLAASDANSMRVPWVVDAPAQNAGSNAGFAVITGLTAGSTVFTAKYRSITTESEVAVFNAPEIGVVTF